MKLATISNQEKIGFEVTPEELFLLHWAVSDYRLLLSHSLKKNKYYFQVPSREKPCPLTLEEKVNLKSKFDRLVEIEKILRLFI